MYWYFETPSDLVREWLLKVYISSDEDEEVLCYEDLLEYCAPDEVMQLEESQTQKRLDYCLEKIEQLKVENSNLYWLLLSRMTLDYYQMFSEPAGDHFCTLIAKQLNLDNIGSFYEENEECLMSVVSASIALAEESFHTYQVQLNFLDDPVYRRLDPFFHLEQRLLQLNCTLFSTESSPCYVEQDYHEMYEDLLNSYLEKEEEIPWDQVPSLLSKMCWKEFSLEEQRELIFRMVQRYYYVCKGYSFVSDSLLKEEDKVLLERFETTDHFAETVDGLLLEPLFFERIQEVYLFGTPEGIHHEILAEKEKEHQYMKKMQPRFEAYQRNRRY